MESHRPESGPNDAYLDPYRDAVARYGPGFEATLWGSREAQLLRFDVMIDLAGGFDRCTILDIGCGPGDLAQRLIDRKIDFDAYIGIDAVESVIDGARARRLDRRRKRVRFDVADVVTHPEAVDNLHPDLVCFSGTLNTMEDQLARRVVGHAFESASRAVVFNFLSDRFHPRWADRDLYPARRFNTVAWLDWAMERSSRVRFRQDYLDGHDATIVIEKEQWKGP